ncbi:UDP-N-acetylglucosamine--dolichyl-phosphate N-acetylglucosaminephosphotransferase [Candidatus Micrarchaeota archaeon]|nr:UDP-N-acetylglucosamine--dolichyl-phosphate N-acetylglucosaminephosphotransferase [Candidatus Micrarchaeota archaeon]
MIEYILFAILSFGVTFIFTKLLIPRLKRVGMTGQDENKIDHPEIPEMGGIAIVAGFTAGTLIAIFADSFFGLNVNMIYLLASILTIHSIAFIGLVDDLIDIPQRVKAFLPLFAAIPLVAVKAAASTVITIPLLGMFDFGVLYILVLIPIAIAVCSNLTNMLAGYNGLETGVGAIAFLALSLIAISRGSTEMGILSVSMLGALLAFLAFNFYPAKIFPGDVGALTIGVVIASAVIIGNIESAGVILVIPYVIDFFIKAVNGFPRTHQEIRNGKLYPKDGKVKGFSHLVMKLSGGITEKGLVLFFMGLESIFAIVVLILYLKV